MKKQQVDFEHAKICIPTSSGGHLTHMMLLKELWQLHDRFWVTFNKIDAQSQLKNERKYWCYTTIFPCRILSKNVFVCRIEKIY